jgi:hypothetical protein
MIERIAIVLFALASLEALEDVAAVWSCSLCLLSFSPKVVLTFECATAAVCEIAGSSKLTATVGILRRHFRQRLQGKHTAFDHAHGDMQTKLGIYFHRFPGIDCVSDCTLASGSSVNENNTGHTCTLHQFLQGLTWNLAATWGMVNTSMQWLGWLQRLCGLENRWMIVYVSLFCHFVRLRHPVLSLEDTTTVTEVYHKQAVIKQCKCWRICVSSYNLRTH